MKFDLKTLPVFKQVKNIVNKIKNNTSTLIEAGTGAGKSVLVPMSLVDHGFKVLVIEPRVANVVGLAETYRSFGYNVRHITGVFKGGDNDADIIICTEPIGLKHITETDRLVVLDEVHTRSIDIDIMLLLLKLLGKRHVLMSATMDTVKTAQYMGGSEIISVEGKIHPVTEKVLDGEIEILNQIEEEYNTGKKVLYFLPTKKTIDEAVNSLTSRGIRAIPFYSDAMRDNIGEIATSKPMVIVTTDTIESGVTVGGNVVVFDGMLQNTVTYTNGIKSLKPLEISQAKAKQRRGRAGRTSSGTYYSRKAITELENKFDVPELLRTPLENLLLKLAYLKIDISTDKLIDQPSAESIEFATKKLTDLKLIDDTGYITKLGKQVYHIGIEPTLGAIFINTPYELRGGMIAIIATLQSSIEADDVLDNTSDILNSLKLYQAYQKRVDSKPTKMVEEFYKGKKNKIQKRRVTKQLSKKEIANDILGKKHCNKIFRFNNAKASLKDKAISDVNIAIKEWDKLRMVILKTVMPFKNDGSRTPYNNGSIAPWLPIVNTDWCIPFESMRLQNGHLHHMGIIPFTSKEVYKTRNELFETRYNYSPIDNTTVTEITEVLLDGYVIETINNDIVIDDVKDIEKADMAYKTWIFDQFYNKVKPSKADDISYSKVVVGTNPIGGDEVHGYVYTDVVNDDMLLYKLTRFESTAMEAVERCNNVLNPTIVSDVTETKKIGWGDKVYTITKDGLDYETIYVQATKTVRTVKWSNGKVVEETLSETTGKEDIQVPYHTYGEVLDIIESNRKKEENKKRLVYLRDRREFMKTLIIDGYSIEDITSLVIEESYGISVSKMDNYKDIQRFIDTHNLYNGFETVNSYDTIEYVMYNNTNLNLVVAKDSDDHYVKYTNLKLPVSESNSLRGNHKPVNNTEMSLADKLTQAWG